MLRRRQAVAFVVAYTEGDGQVVAVGGAAFLTNDRLAERGQRGARGRAPRAAAPARPCGSSMRPSPPAAATRRSTTSSRTASSAACCSSALAFVVYALWRAIRLGRPVPRGPARRDRRLRAGRGHRPPAGPHPLAGRRRRDAAGRPAPLASAPGLGVPADRGRRSPGRRRVRRLGRRRRPHPRRHRRAPRHHRRRARGRRPSGRVRPPGGPPLTAAPTRSGPRAAVLAVREEVGQGRRRPGGDALRARHGAARRRPRAARGRARRGQDAARQGARRGPRPRVHAGAVHARPDALRRRSASSIFASAGPAGATVSSASARGPSSRTCCWPTRSTAPRPRPRPRCSRRWRSARSPSRARPARCPTRSSSSPPRTPSSTRAPTRCPRPSSTASCSSCRSATRPPSRSRRCSLATTRASTRTTSRRLVRPVATAADLAAARLQVDDVRVEPPVLAYVVSLARATRESPSLSLGCRPGAPRCCCTRPRPGPG